MFISFIKKLVNQAAHGILMSVGYCLVGPIAGVVSFFWTQEQMIIAGIMLYGAITAQPLLFCSIRALQAGALFGAISTLATMRFNACRMFVLNWIISNIVEPTSKFLFGFLFGITSENFQKNCPSYATFFEEFENCVKQTPVLTPFARALSFGMHAANQIHPLCYSQSTLTSAIFFGNYGMVP